MYKGLKNFGKGLLMGATLSAIGCSREFEGDVTNKVGFFRGESYNLAFTLDERTFYIQDIEESRKVDQGIPYRRPFQVNMKEFRRVSPEKLREIILSEGRIDSTRSFEMINSSCTPSVKDFLEQPTEFYVLR